METQAKCLLLLCLLGISFCTPQKSLIPIGESETGEIFGKYKCKLCKDFIVDNVGFISGEAKENEKLVMTVCESIMGLILPPTKFLVCSAVKARIDALLSEVASPKKLQKFAENTCNKIRVCSDDE